MLFFISFAALMTAWFFIQRYISQARVKVIITDETLTIKWLSQFIFHKRIDIEKSLNEINSYKYQEDSNFDLFKLTFTDGTDIRFWHFTFTHGDDFDKLIEDFPKMVREFNTQKTNINSFTGNSSEHKIEKAKTIYEKSYAPFLAVFAILMIIAVPVILMTNSPGKSKNPFLLIAPMGGAIFFVAKYFTYRKRK